MLTPHPRFAAPTQRLAFGVLFSLCAAPLSAQPEPAPQAQPAPLQHAQPTPQGAVQEAPQGVARSGAVTWSAEEALQGLRYQQVWMQWSQLSPPPVEALEDERVRRRALIEAIEQELLWREAGRRGFTLSFDEVKAWLLAKLPGAERPSLEGLDDVIRARLQLRAEASLALFWHTIERVARIDRLRDALIEALSEDEAKAEWLKRGRLVGLNMLLIPRVPTNVEITEAIPRLQAEMRAYYDAHPTLFSQPDRALVTPLYLSTTGKGERERAQLSEVSQLLASGQSIDEVRERFPTLQSRPQQSVNAKTLPQGTPLKEGAYSAPRLTRHGWSIYHVVRVYKGYQRAFDEVSVQRECASAVLIERDELKSARKIAERGRELLRYGSDEALTSWAKSRRVHFKQPAPFYANPNHVIPTLGTAPELHKELFELKLNEVSEVRAVRQSYVVAKITSQQEREQPWAEARDEFMSAWRAERRHHVLNDWLSAHLKGAPRWVSTSGLKGLEIERLKAPLSDSIAPLRALSVPVSAPAEPVPPPAEPVSP